MSQHSEVSPPSSAYRPPHDILSRHGVNPVTFMAAVLVAIWILRLLTLGAYPLVDSTEGRYAEIAREMAVTGNWVVPHLDPGVPFWGKPPLAFWAKAVSFHLFGFTEFAARFPAYVFAVVTLLLTMLLVAGRFGWHAALRAALILSTCVLFFVMAAGVLTDPALLVSITLAMAGFAHCVILKKHSRFFGYLFFAGLALGALSKGLVGIVIPAVAIAPWVLIYGKFRALKELPWLGGSLLFLFLAVPWHLLAEVQTPGFLRYYIVGEHFQRFLDRSWEGDLYGNPHEEPKGMIWLFWLAAAMPWTLLMVFGLVHRAWRRQSFLPKDPMTGFLLAWMFAPLLFFTLSDNVIITYVLPALPPFALLLERLLGTSALATPAAEVGKPRVHQWRFITGLAFAVAVLGNAGTLTIYPFVAEERSQRSIVDSYMAIRTSGDAELLYFDKRPYSAEFYSHGKAVIVSREDVQAIRQRIEAGHEIFIVVDEDDLEHFPFWPGDGRLEKRAQGGEYILLHRPSGET